MSAQWEVEHQKTELETIAREIRKIEAEEFAVTALHEKMRNEFEDHQREVERDILKQKNKLKEVLEKKVKLAEDKTRKLKEQKEREDKLRRAEESLRKELEEKNKK